MSYILSKLRVYNSSIYSSNTFTIFSIASTYICDVIEYSNRVNVQVEWCSFLKKWVYELNDVTRNVHLLICEKESRQMSYVLSDKFKTGLHQSIHLVWGVKRNMIRYIFIKKEYISFLVFAFTIFEFISWWVNQLRNEIIVNNIRKIKSNESIQELHINRQYQLRWHLLNLKFQREINVL